MLFRSQARASGFVQRVYSRAPGDVIGAGAPLADLLVPAWAGAQAEYLAVRQTGDAALTRATRPRLAPLGIPSSPLAAVALGGRPHKVNHVAAPPTGDIQTHRVRR